MWWISVEFHFLISPHSYHMDWRATKTYGFEWIQVWSLVKQNLKNIYCFQKKGNEI
jgi:hypothetical protein